MVAGPGNAPGSRRLQRRANLSQLPSQLNLKKWSFRQESHPLPLDYRSSALLIELRKEKDGGGGEDRTPTALAGPSRFSKPISAPAVRTSKWKNGSPAWIRTKASRINNPVGYCYPTGERDRKLVGAGGNAPLVGFRTVLRRRVYSPLSGAAPFFEGNWWQAPVMLRVSRVMSPGSRLPGLRSD